MLIDEQGGLLKLHFTLDGHQATVIGTSKGGKKISEAIDEVKTQGRYEYYTRGQLFIMQKNGRIK